MADQAELVMQSIATGPMGPHYKLGKHNFDVFIYPAVGTQNAKMAVVLNVNTVKSPPTGSGPLPPGSVLGRIAGSLDTGTGNFTIDTTLQTLVFKIQNLNSTANPSSIRIELELPGAAIPAVAPVPASESLKS